MEAAQGLRQIATEIGTEVVIIWAPIGLWARRKSKLCNTHTRSPARMGFATWVCAQ